MTPFLFKNKNGTWEHSKTYEKTGKMVKSTSMVQSNMKIFEQGKLAGDRLEDKVGHTNPIVCIKRAAETGLFFSADNHGNFYVWPI